MKTMNNFIISAVASVVLAGAEARADFMQCIQCPAGYQCDGTNKTQCSAGTYATGGASSCSQCGANTYSSAGASGCTPCGELEWSNAGASRCSGLQYQIESTIADLTYFSYADGTSKAYLQSGTLQPGFYLIVLGGGDGGHTRDFRSIGAESLYGKGAQLKYIFKITSETSYTIASASAGDPVDSEEYIYGSPSERNVATGGGGGAWATIGGTTYIAGGGGGAPATILYSRVGASGGGGGAVGRGGNGGYNCGDDECNGSGAPGGSSGQAYCNGSANCYNFGTTPGANGHDSSSSCYTASNSNSYGGVGGIVSEIQCPGFSLLDWGDDDTPALYWQKPTDGKVSHSDNTSGHFADKLCKNCARLYKIK